MATKAGKAPLYRRGAGQREHNIGTTFSDEEYANLMALASQTAVAGSGRPLPARAIREAVAEICRQRGIGASQREEVAAEQAA